MAQHELTCRICGTSFFATRADARACSSRCRQIASRRASTTPRVRIVWNGPVATLSQSMTKRKKVPGTGHDGIPARWMVVPVTISNADLATALLRIAMFDDGGAPKTGRRIYYLALSHRLIQPDMGASDEAAKERDAAYKKVLDLLGTLRKSGRLSWHMVLDLTRDIDEWQTYASPRHARAELRERYEEDRWIGQPYFPIIICEKDTLEPTVKPMASDWQIPFVSSRGYGSLTLQHNVALLLKRRMVQMNQKPIIYFVSDFDPSGLDLQSAWEQAMRDFGVAVTFVRLGMNEEQADDYPHLSIEVKVSDARSKSFSDQYGDRCWEADVLPSSVIKDALDEDIKSWIDRAKWVQRDAEIELGRKLL